MRNCHLIVIGIFFWHMLSKFFHRNSTDFGVPIFFCEFFCGAASVNHTIFWILNKPRLLWGTWFGTMGLCELYWISICLCEHRGKLRSSKQHRFGLIFWVVFCFSVVCFCLCFLFLLVSVCVFDFAFDLFFLCVFRSQTKTTTPPRKKYIQTPDRPPLAAVTW